jgi:hypothetical protein
VVAFAACGGAIEGEGGSIDPKGSGDGPTASGSDAGFHPGKDAGPIVTVDAEAQEPGENHPPDAGKAVCPGGHSPSGLFCDWGRILTPKAAPRDPCAEVPLGTFCDQIVFTVMPGDPITASVPPTFRCSWDLGAGSCWYITESGSWLEVDDAALEAACRITAISPGTTVACVVLD